jgi:replicative DNA helicase
MNVEAPIPFRRRDALDAVSVGGRTMPHSIEAEESLLSCCLLDGADVVGRCLEARIQPESFYVAAHGIIFERLIALYNRQVPISVDVLAAELQTAKQLEQIGGYPFLAQVSSRIPTTAQAGFFIEKVRELALLRNLIRVATGTVEECYDFSGGIDEFVDELEQKFFAVTQTRVADRVQPSARIVSDAFKVITSMLERRGQKTGVCTGFRDLDALTWGFQRQNLVVIAARPSMGKTSLALNMADHIVAPQRGDQAAGNVLFFSLEMAATELMQRMICSRSRVNMKLLRDGLLSKNGEETMRLVNAADELSRASLYIDDSSSITVSAIRARARRLHGRKPLSAIFVDYLQLLTPANAKVPREQQVSADSRGLKSLAKELNVPVIVMSQLNRLSDKEKRAPRLSDLRESGAIEQDADVVLFLARPNDADERFQVAADSAELVIAKQRNGPVGSLKLTFLRDITRFENFIQ